MNPDLPSWRVLWRGAPSIAARLVAVEVVLVLAISLRPWALGHLVDGALTYPDHPSLFCAGWAIVLGLLWMVRHLLTCAKDGVVMRVGIRFSDRARIAAIRQLQTMPLAALDASGGAQVAELMERDLAVLDASAVRAPLDLASTVARLLLASLLVAWMCPPVLGCLAVLLILVIAALVAARSLTMPLLHERAIRCARLGAACRETIGARESIRQAAATAEVSARIGQLQRALSCIQGRLLWRNAWLQPLMLVLLHVGLGGVLVFGGRAVARGTLSYGELTSCLFLVFLVLGPLQELVANWDQCTAIASARRRLDALLRTSKPDPAVVAVVPPSGATLSSTRLAFAYHGRPSPIATEPLIVAPGERVLIRGPSGVGKSTVVQLLSGMLAPDRGTVHLGDADLHRLPTATLRRRLVTVMQGDALFAGTILDNLRMAVPPDVVGSAVDDRIHRVAQALGSQAIIQALPDGWLTRIGGDGLELDAEVRQQVALLRGVLRSPEMLILDEATSALDGITALRLYERVAGQVRTLVVVDHRPAMAVMASRVIDLAIR